MTYTQTEYGNINGNKVQLFALENNKGVTVKISNYGATITSITTPNNQGEVEEITCGFEKLNGYFSEAYKNNAPYFGGTVGRYCSQIKDAKFNLNGKEYLLNKNCGDNNLHGGTIGYNVKTWEATPFKNDTEVGVEMSIESKDLEEGFPGNVNVKVKFTLTEENELQIAYNAISDQDTPFSTTNHTYFNLSGFKSTIEDHKVNIRASKKLELDNSGAATGLIVDVVNTAEDLREDVSIKSVHEAINDGFEHYYVFDKNNFDLEKVATITCEESGRSLVVSSSEPGMLFYTGKYTSNELQKENGLQYGKYRGFCCETHRYPNGMNINGPKSILKANEVFSSKTNFKFTW